MQIDTTSPAPRSLTSAPLRNRLRVELEAPVSEVWSLVGDIERLPEYSAGLERVEVNESPGGVPAAYVCHFKPTEEGAAGAISRDLVRWHEPNRGWASLADEPNDFGLRNCLTVVTLEPLGQGTALAWDAYYDADDNTAFLAHFDEAIADIAQRLVARFGGRVVERYVEGRR
jgi:hypothetical protein